MSITIDTPDCTDIAIANTAEINALVVKDDASADRAGGWLRDIKALQKQITERFEPAVSAANKAHKELTKLRSSLLEPLESAERTLKNRVAIYLQEKQRLAIEEQRRNEAEARRKAEEERLASAAQLEAQGRVAEAQAEIEAPFEAPVAEAKPVVEAPKGFSTREVWSAECLNLHELCKFVAANPQMIGLISPNQKALDAFAKSMKKDFKVPGCRAVMTATGSVRI